MTDTGQMTFNDILNIIQDYHWIIKEINRLQLQLNQVETVGVAVYTDEPKAAQSEPSRRVEKEVVRREINHRRLQKYRLRVKYLQCRMHFIKGDKEQAVLDCLLDGMSLNAIALHLSIHRKTVRGIRNSIIDGIQKGQEVP
ncbi:hypothetical protein DHX103_14385 [Planococcus sp. X10-3]|uniref:hypothetical protein n=1 Tax=Planococcus sp. X10-3 TaxID=3061240 RepID=UPI003BB117EA